MCIRDSIHGDINPTGQQQSGFYYDNSVWLYSYYYDDVVLESKVIADDEMETTSNTSYVVTTEEGLRKALESDADEINVDVPITLTSDIELKKPVNFSGVTVTNGATVVAINDWWCSELNIDNGIVIQEKGCVSISRTNVSRLEITSDGVPVSYTHLDVYKRQVYSYRDPESHSYSASRQQRSHLPLRR